MIFFFQEKILKIVNEAKRGKFKDYNTIIQSNKEFRNPSIYEKLINHLELDEMGSNYPLVSVVVFNIYLTT